MEPTKTVFKALILHGIRDYAHDFDEIQGKVEEQAAKRGMRPIVLSPRYRYFSALQFITPWERTARIHEFADVYAELVAIPPHDVPINVAGHSFRSYLLGTALTKYTKIEYGRVYLAGSVLSESYPWNSDNIRGLWAAVRNDTAAGDFPVGVLCAGLESLGLAPGIGKGGFDGFPALDKIPGKHTVQNSNLPGGHGAFVRIKDDIAKWLIQGDEQAHLPSDHKVDRSQLLELLSRSAWLLTISLLLLLFYLILFGRHPWLGATELLILLTVLSVY